MNQWIARTAARLADADSSVALAGAWTLFDETAAWAIGPAADQGDALAATGAYNLAVEARELLAQPEHDDQADDLDLTDAPAIAGLLDQAEQRLNTIADATAAVDAHGPARASLLAGRAARSVRTAGGVR
ncbi:hypothetical protein ACFQ0M_48635 [Kitasatospora aburaviensis]|uniref:Uncharacterized protein n=1 Tax=Kitasatospora aburaviensis TaxID=67265 RepID=A0ABW1F623_9ACTN